VRTDASKSIIRTLKQAKIPVVFPVYPCTRNYPDESGAAGVYAIAYQNHKTSRIPETGAQLMANSKKVNCRLHAVCRRGHTCMVYPYITPCMNTDFGEVTLHDGGMRVLVQMQEWSSLKSGLPFQYNHNVISTRQEHIAKSECSSIQGSGPLNPYENLHFVFTVQR